MRTDYHLCHIVNKVTVQLLHLLIIRLSQPQNNQIPAKFTALFYDFL